jgi:hypothetical protein
VLTPSHHSRTGLASPTSCKQKAVGQCRRKRGTCHVSRYSTETRHNGAVEEDKEDECDVAVHASPQMFARRAQKQTGEDQKKQKARRPEIIPLCKTHASSFMGRSSPHLLGDTTRGLCGMLAQTKHTCLPASTRRLVVVVLLLLRSCAVDSLGV